MTLAIDKMCDFIHDSTESAGEKKKECKKRKATSLPPADDGSKKPAHDLRNQGYPGYGNPAMGGGYSPYGMDYGYGGMGMYPWYGYGLETVWPWCPVTP
jgi:hypothetical protein